MTMTTLTAVAEEIGVPVRNLRVLRHNYDKRGLFPKPAPIAGQTFQYDKKELISFLRSIDYIDKEGNRAPRRGARRIDKDAVKTILATYKKTGHISSAAKASGVSYGTARKYLVDAGVLTCSCHCHRA